MMIYKSQKKIFVLLLLLGTAIHTFAQVVRLQPANPAVDAEVTVYFNAAEGNKTLMGYTGDVYLHTGVITNKSIDGHDWKYVVGNWGKADPAVLMQREGPDLYSFRMQIRSFYKLKDEDVAQQLAFVFRNADGTIAAKTAGNEDITVPVNGYKPPEKITEKIENPERKIIRIEKRITGWMVYTDQGSVLIEPYSGAVMGITFIPDDEPAVDSSYAVIQKPGQADLHTQSFPGGQLLSSGELSVFAHYDPYRLAFIYQGDTILREEDGFFEQPGNRGVRFQLGKDEAIYGAGERAVSLDRRGYRFPLYNRPFYGYEMGATMLNYSMPLTFSSEKYALLFDNPQKGYVDIGKTEPDIMEWGTLGGTLRYFVVAGGDWPSVLKSYTELTGRQPLPPRWALGNLQSRMAYRNQAETDSIVKLMQQKHFPMDAIILDFYWFGDSIQGHLGNLDWYRKAWPDPEGMISRFRMLGVKTILITEPYVIDTVANWNDAAEKGVFVTDSLGRPYLDKQFYFGTGSLIDIFKPEARDWFWSKYKKQVENGVAGWWGDLGEPESHPSDIHHVNGKADEVHNIYGHYWDKMLFEKYTREYPGTRLFHLQRSGFAGTQRYSAYPWTGDVSRSWGGFQAQLPLLLTMSLSGLGYIHSDAGGFAQGVADDELYTRWLQFAIFTPILRPHGSDIPSEPVYWSEKTQEIVRNYMELRYRMLPYNYSLAWQNATTGAPLIRPLFYEYPSDSIAAAINDQYLWGDRILIAPVTEKGLKSRKVYLPEGNWFDFRTGMEYNGRQWIVYPLTIEDIPVFVKAGSFIPMTRAITTTDHYKADEYCIRYYPSGKSSFTQYEDDGLDNFALGNNNFELIDYQGEKQGAVTTIRISHRGKWKGMPASRTMTLKVRKNGLPGRVLIGDQEVQQDNGTGNKKAFYCYGDGWLEICFRWNGKPVTIEIQEPRNL